MKIYTVMQAAYKVTDDDDASIFIGPNVDPLVYLTEDEAIQDAKRIARQHPGWQVWVVEGEAKHGFHVEPLPVTASVPVVRVCND